MQTGAQPGGLALTLFLCGFLIWLPEFSRSKAESPENTKLNRRQGNSTLNCTQVPWKQRNKSSPSRLNPQGQESSNKEPWEVDFRHRPCLPHPLLDLDFYLKPRISISQVDPCCAEMPSRFFVQTSWPWPAVCLPESVGGGCTWWWWVQAG